MVQIQDLEQRIAAAFARISAGVEVMAGENSVARVSAGASVSTNVPTLQALLDEERVANARLNERLGDLRQQATQSELALQEQVVTLTRHLDAQGLDVQRLSGTVAQLREDLRRLREAAVQGVVDPGLINRAMMAELDALRIARAAETTEMTDILHSLSPILDAEEARAHART
jgi:uncharacterized protein (DUF885 family)